MRSFKAADEDALLKAILQESANEILVFDAETLQIIQANPAAAKNLQRPLKALRQLTPLDCLSAEDAHTFTTLLAVLQSGKKRRASFNAHCCRSDGSCYPVEAKLSRSAGQGKPIFIWIASDVSQREATQQALAHSASDLRAIVAHIPGMAFQVLRTPDGSTSLRYVSDQSAQLLGIKAAALRADPERFFKLIMQEDKADYLARLAASGGVHMSFNWEGRIWMEAWKDVKWVNIRVSQREAPDGLIWDGIMLNVTKSRLAEAEIRRSRAQLAALAAHVESVREQERLHLAREVHDDLGGNLTAIKIGLSWLMRHLPPGELNLYKRTAYLDNVANQTIDATHRIASSLRPPVLDFGIVSAIEWQLERFGQNTDIAYEFSAPDDAIPLGPDIAIAVFRIVQEALTNVAKHAHATQVKVALARQPDSLLLTVTDNGRGIQPGQGKNSAHGFGLLGMSERAAALGGELSVAPAKRRGTQVSLRILLPATAK
ncbi:MAG: PAS domain S-box protein [Gammaproteobacteria bacterium]|nr:PAS domain S-box protein [Gammaproteobacteria bacterium]